MRHFSPETQAEAMALLEEYPNKRSALLMVLRLAESEFGCIDDGGMELVASLCGVNVAHVQGIVTFYTHFKRPYHGKHRFMVCATLMCALEDNAKQALRQIEETLGLKPGERTADGLFSCEKVECLADCDRPPVVQVDAQHYIRCKGDNLTGILSRLLAEEGKTDADYKGRAGVVMDTTVPSLPVHHRFGEEDKTGNRGLEAGREKQRVGGVS